MYEFSIPGFESFYLLFKLTVLENGTLKMSDITPPLPHFAADQREVFENFLSSSGHVKNLFIIPGIDEVNILNRIEYNKLYPLRTDYQRSLYALNLYSSVPTYFCIFTNENGNLIANILHKPALSGSENSPIVFFDEAEYIHAFNIPFLQLFSDIASSKDDFFSKNMSTIFNETPKQISNRLFLDATTLNKSTKETNLLTPGELLSIDKNGLFSGTREIYPSEYKTSLHLRYKSTKSAPPVFMFGASSTAPITGYSPDYAGFSIGTNVEGTHLLLKKSGWVVLSSQIPEIKEDEHTVVITLHRKKIEYIIDDKILFQHDLFETHWPSSCYFHLSIRPGHSFNPVKFTLIEENHTKSNIEERPLIQFRHLPTRFFTIAYIPRMFFSGNTIGIRGIELHEVTNLQREIINSRESIVSLKRNRELSNREVKFVGESPVVRKMMNQVQPIARSEMTVLLSGPTGAGKEVLARYIHANSPRYDKPFIKMDCSTIPDSLFESIVFGHIKGAFTGATHSTTGIIESANQGTVFIDEIQNLSLNSQAKLLRILEERIIQKTGSNETINVDVRFIAGTNQNLEKRIKEATFREDLYYRINLAIIALPSLETRKEDIPELCLHFIRQYNNEMAARVGSLSIKCINILQNYNWPGNVRELKNVIYHACIFAVNNEITPEMIMQIINGKDSITHYNTTTESHRQSTGAKHYRDILDKNNGNAAKAAKELKISRNTLYYNLKKYGINPDDFRH